MVLTRQHNIPLLYLDFNVNLKHNCNYSQINVKGNVMSINSTNPKLIREEYRLQTLKNEAERTKNKIDFLSGIQSQSEYSQNSCSLLGDMTVILKNKITDYELVGKDTSNATSEMQKIVKKMKKVCNPTL